MQRETCGEAVELLQLETLIVIGWGTDMGRYTKLQNTITVKRNGMGIHASTPVETVPSANEYTI